MIRYVHLRKADKVFPETDGFAWFDTVSDTFLAFDGEQAWDCWGDFVMAWTSERKQHELVMFQKLFQGDDT